MFTIEFMKKNPEININICPIEKFFNLLKLLEHLVLHKQLEFWINY